jgi:hypothetical protein
VRVDERGVRHVDEERGDPRGEQVEAGEERQGEDGSERENESVHGIKTFRGG